MISGEGRKPDGFADFFMYVLRFFFPGVGRGQ